jgi:hypothetical protein
VIVGVAAYGRAVIAPFDAERLARELLGNGGRETRV